MINTDRIVPVMNIDLLSLYGLILLQDSNNSGLAKLAADTIDGDFQIKVNNELALADQPVKTLDIDVTTSLVSACTVYFVADYHYVGITKDGAAVVPADGSDDVIPDARTLYKAVLSSGDITITKIGF